MTSMTLKHPARFSTEVLDDIAQVLRSQRVPKRVLDPFAGTGLVHALDLDFAVGVELEPEWAACSPGVLVGNTLHLPFPDATFDGMITSPAFGNRLADSHHAKDGSVRRSYTHDLGRKLHPDNSGALQWGEGYRAFHERAWTEVLRTMEPGALLVLNVGNHLRTRTRTVEGEKVRTQEVQNVIEWHMNWFTDHGCAVEDARRVGTKGLRFGANYEARLGWEAVMVMTYVAPVLTPEEDDPDADDAWFDDPPQRPGLLDDVDAGEGGDCP